MKTLNLAACAGLVLALALAAAGFDWHLAAPAHSAPAVAAARPEATRPPAKPGLIRFNADDPQLSYLKIASIGAQALPLAEPVAGRIAYDEGRTSRIASPVLGRVTAQRVEVGDPVRAGQLLADLDSPDLASAQADALKATADQERKRLALDRAQTLVDADVLARKEVEEARADARAAGRRGAPARASASATCTRNGPVMAASGWSRRSPASSPTSRSTWARKCVPTSRTRCS